jgi:phospholipid transport system substrate-binding protein
MTRFKAILIIIFLGLTASNVLANEIRPERIVAVFHDALLTVMKKSNTSSAKERYAQLEPAIDKAFALGFMIKVASGTSWRAMSEAHRVKLAKAFRHMSIATYAFRFKGYSGQYFKILKTSDGPRKTQLVYTYIISPKDNKRDKQVKLTYVTKKFAEGWKIVDVLLDGGISELSVRHSEYRTILKTKGAGILAKRLNKKADQLIAN